jgi:hypothetical protein
MSRGHMCWPRHEDRQSPPMSVPIDGASFRTLPRDEHKKERRGTSR